MLVLYLLYNAKVFLAMFGVITSVLPDYTGY